MDEASFDELFNELAVMARKQSEVQIIRQEQDGLIKLLKKEFTVNQYKLHSELMDGVLKFKQIQDFMSDDITVG